MNSHPYVNWLAPDKIIKDSLWEAVSKASRYARGDLLDIGCGEKPYYEIFKDKVSSYIGLDLKGGDVKGSALDLPFPDEHFDTIFSSQVIEHIEDSFLMMQEASRVLKKGGHLILTAPLFWCLHEEPKDFFRFTKYGLNLLAKKSGLKIVYIKECGSWLSTLGQMISLFLESTANRTVLRFPKKIIQIIFQYISWKLSKIKRLAKNKQAPLGYIMVARKPK